MNNCCRCGEEIVFDDLTNELCAQANALGMESLTEDEQLLVLGKLCEHCFYII